MTQKYRSYCENCNEETTHEVVGLMDVDGIESTAIECELCGRTEEITD
ncbi:MULTISPECIES: hypothetical protein [unclassified Vibrio]